MSQIEVQIMGQGYLLTCPIGGEELMMQAVEKVDGAMCKIRDAGKVRARDRIAVLASLNLAVELAEAQMALNDLKAQQPVEAPPSAGEAVAITSPSPAQANSTQMAEWVARIDRALDSDGQLL
jgi:cell division protein ZapA